MRHLQRGLRALVLLPLIAFPFAARSEEQPAPPSDLSRQDGSLSKKLNTTSGVIHPDEGIDPGMQKAPPATGPMPVVPPPGTPGGRSDVTPK